MAAEVQREITALDCPVALQFIRELGEKLAPQLSGDRPEYQFSLILNDTGGPQHEPYSLPAGYIFVPASLILSASSEAEVARMLAHSMAHRFPAVSGQMSGYGTIPLVFVSGSFPLRSLVPPRFVAQLAAMERVADLEASPSLDGGRI